jgi:hypothetical protein
MFNIVVVDNEDPVIAAAADINQSSPGAAGVAVTFPTPSATDNSGLASVVCTPASGSTFAVGVATVTCTATDAANNSASTSFTVTVTLDPVTLPETGGGLDGFTMALQLLVAGLALVGISRVRVRRRLATK